MGWGNELGKDYYEHAHTHCDEQYRRLADDPDRPQNEILAKLHDPLQINHPDQPKPERRANRLETFRADVILRGAERMLLDGSEPDLETTEINSLDDLYEFCQQVESSKVFPCQMRDVREAAEGLGCWVELPTMPSDVDLFVARNENNNALIDAWANTVASFRNQIRLRLSEIGFCPVRIVLPEPGQTAVAVLDEEKQTGEGRIPVIPKESLVDNVLLSKIKSEQDERESKQAALSTTPAGQAAVTELNGVTLLDVAIEIEGGDDIAAKKLVADIGKSRKLTAEKIGKCPRDSRAYLYEFPGILDIFGEFLTLSTTEKSTIASVLRKKLRFPR